MKSLRADKVANGWSVVIEHRHHLSTTTDVKKLIRQEGLIARPEFGTKNAKGDVTSIYAD